MKRDHNKAFPNVEQESFEPERKIQLRKREHSLSTDTLGVIASFLPTDDCARVRLVSRDWDFQALKTLERSNVHLRLLGNATDEINPSPEMEHITSGLNIHTVYNVGSWKIRDLPSYFRGLIIERLDSEQIISLFTDDLGNVKKITISNSIVEPLISDILLRSNAETISFVF